MGEEMLTMDECLQMAAQAWCEPETSSRLMDPVLAKAFAGILYRLANGAPEAGVEVKEGAAHSLEALVGEDRCPFCLQMADAYAKGGQDAYAPLRDEVKKLGQENARLSGAPLTDVGVLALERAEATVMRCTEALRETSQGVDKEGVACWCRLPSMIPYRGHDVGCVLARGALGMAWIDPTREGADPGA